MTLPFLLFFPEDLKSNDTQNRSDGIANHICERGIPRGEPGLVRRAISIRAVLWYYNDFVKVHDFEPEIFLQIVGNGGIDFA